MNFILKLQYIALVFLLTGIMNALGSDNFYFTSPLTSSPKSFLHALKNHMLNHYDADHPIDTSKMIINTLKCNPDKDLRNPFDYKNGFSMCLPLFRYGLWAGSGSIATTNSDKLGRNITTTGMANYIGGQFIFPSSFSSQYIYEGTYWYLPTFSSAEDAVKNLEESSMLEQLLYYQKRISPTNWSWRFGLMAQTAPIPRDFNTSPAISNIDIRPHTSLQAGPLFGLRWVKDKLQGGHHFFHGDYVNLAYSDNRPTKKLASSYIFRLGYQWYFFYNMALTFNTEIQHFYNHYGDEVSVALWGVGIKTFFF